MQIDRLSDELRAARGNIRNLEKPAPWRPNALALVCLAFVVALSIDTFGTKASSGNNATERSTPSTDVPTKVKAPFEVVDDSGRTILRVQDNDPSPSGVGRGAYIVDPSNKIAVDLTSSTLGGGRVRVRSASDQLKFVQMSSNDTLFGLQLAIDGKNTMAQIGQFEGKDPVIELNNASGKPAAALSLKTGEGNVSVFGSADKPAATLQSDSGEGKLWVNDKGGRAVAGVISNDSGGVVKVMKNGDATTYTSISAIEKGMGLAVRIGGVRKSFVGTNEEGNGAVLVYSAGEDAVAGLSTNGGKGLVGAFSHGVPIAFLTESDKHPGGGSVTATDPGGNGIFSAGFTGEGGDACINRKSGLKCLGIGLPLQINR